MIRLRTGLNIPYRMMAVANLLPEVDRFFHECRYASIKGPVIVEDVFSR
jgi:hypothetical protein